jgi:hypothetical protein
VKLSSSLGVLGVLGVGHRILPLFPTHPRIGDRWQVQFVYFGYDDIVVYASF